VIKILGGDSFTQKQITRNQSRAANNAALRCEGATTSTIHTIRVVTNTAYLLNLPATTITVPMLSTFRNPKVVFKLWEPPWMREIHICKLTRVKRWCKHEAMLSIVRTRLLYRVEFIGWKIQPYDKWYQNAVDFKIVQLKVRKYIQEQLMCFENFIEQVEEGEDALSFIN
jgi:hypothetical protein